MNEMVKNVLEVCASIIISLGGASGIIIIISKFLSNKIANVLEAKYQLKLDKEIENYKTALDSKNHITKAKYDLEIDTFKELSEKFYNVVYYSNCLIPAGLSKSLVDKEKQEELDNEIYRKLCSSNLDAQNCLISNSAFIPNEFYQLYLSIHKKAMLQMDAYSKRWNLSYFGSEEEKKNFKTEDYIRSKEMINDLENINEKIRDRLSSLEII